MRSQTENNRITKVIESTFKNLSSIVDANTVVGKPIRTDDGKYIVPVSKVTVGIIMGGGEYGKINIFKKNEDLPYSAGNGAVVSVKPCGFLIKEGKKFKVLNVSDRPYEKLLDKTADLISEFGRMNDEEKI